MIMKKKLIVIAMSSIFVLALVGCGTKDNTSVADKTNNSSVEDIEKTQDIIKEAKQKGLVIFLSLFFSKKQNNKFIVEKHK